MYKKRRRQLSQKQVLVKARMLNYSHHAQNLPSVISVKLITVAIILVSTRASRTTLQPHVHFVSQLLRDLQLVTLLPVSYAMVSSP